MSSDSAPVIERVQNFLAEHKKVVLVSAAVAAVAVGGAAYYASTSSSRTAPGDVEKGDKKEKKKSSKSKGGKKKSVKNADGPILEERPPKAAVEEEDVVPSAEQIAVMPEAERKTLAASFKSKGNTAYQQRKFSLAVELYSHAIAVSPTPEPVFYSNRAACFMNISPPEYERVVEDCNEALKLDLNYVKALNRRATALEHLSRLEEALRDFTAAAILERFSNQAAAQSVDRVLKKLAEAKAKEIIAERGPKLPSFTFISAYFAAFRPRPRPTLPEAPTQGDQTLILAIEALDASDYIHAFTLVNESLEQGISWDAGKAEALNLRATFKFLMSDIEGSKLDFLESIKLHPSFTQSLVKIASVYMEQNAPEQAFHCFDDAIKQNPDDPDIYYHRGQVLFIMGKYAEAAENYVKSSELDPDFMFSHIQLAVAQYKDEKLKDSMVTFRKTLKHFPNRSEPHNYYGELLLDQQRFEDAQEKFEKAIELEKQKDTTKTTPNVLPLVNMALAIYQGKQDVGAAERYCNEALRIDPECDAAVATLSQFALQQGKFEKAAEYLGKQAELARTEMELVNALAYKYASSAQLEFMKNYPGMRDQLAPLAQSL